MHETKVFNLNKTVEAAAYLLQLHGERKRVKFIKILKLLYMADREALERWEHQITNDDFYSMGKGQVLSKTYDLMKRGAISDQWDNYFRHEYDHRISLKNPVKLRYLSPADVELLEDVFAKYGEYDPFDLADITHDLPEYVDPGTSSIRTPLTKVLQVLGYSEDDVERILEETEEQAKLDRILGA